MKGYILKRLLISVVTIMVILFILFAMLQLMPGSPFNDEKMTQTQLEILNAKYGLDEPFFNQFFRYIKNTLSGDFGVSYNIQSNMPISKLVLARMPITIRIALQAAVLGFIIGLPLGIVAAFKRNTIFDSLATGISVLGVSLPNFVFALALSYFFGYKLKLFPILFSTKNIFQSTILPTISLSMFIIANVARYARNEVIEILSTDYIQLAESKGLPRYSLIIKHVLRNALIGVITVLAPLVVNLMTGSLVVEKAFSIPGLGSLFVTAIQTNDFNVIIAISFLYSAIYIGVMLVVDILYSVIDPRVRLTGGK